MDKLQAIRYFQKLGENLSFNGTAQHFGVPASKVSRAIKALEEHLGVTLVERTTRQVRLTETGTLYRDEITPALRSLSAADDLVAEHSQEASGTIRITFPPGYGELRLFKVLEKFERTTPRLSVIWSLATTIWTSPVARSMSLYASPTVLRNISLRNGYL